MWVPTLLAFAKVDAHAIAVGSNPQVMEAASLLLWDILNRDARVILGPLAAGTVGLSTSVLTITLAFALTSIAAFALAFVTFPGTGTG